jgi:hypothetical protein
VGAVLGAVDGILSTNKQNLNWFCGRWNDRWVFVNEVKLKKTELVLWMLE